MKYFFIWKGYTRIDKIIYGFSCILDGLITVLTLGTLGSRFSLEFCFWMASTVAKLTKDTWKEGLDDSSCSSS